MSGKLDAENVVFRYMGQAKGIPSILDGITISIAEGEFVAILGRNGCGKSTLSKHFCGLLLPSGGKVYIDGIDTRSSGKREEIHQTVGMIFQNPDNQIVSSIVEEDVAFALENLEVPTDEIQTRVNEALETVDMASYRKHATHKLSGGQKQRIAIASIIAMRPKYIVLDEPTSMLDPKGRKEVMGTIKKLNEEYGITIILITHYMEEAAAAKRVLVMDEGKILLNGNPKEVFSQVELLKELHLDVPQVTEFIYRLCKRGVPLPNDIIEVSECVEALTAILEDENVYTRN